MDFADRPRDRAVKIRINILEVLDNADLIAISGEEGNQLLVIHATEDCTLADLKAVDV